MSAPSYDDAYYESLRDYIIDWNKRESQQKIAEQLRDVTQGTISAFINRKIFHSPTIARCIEKRFPLVNREIIIKSQRQLVRDDASYNQGTQTTHRYSSDGGSRSRLGEDFIFFHYGSSNADKGVNEGHDTRKLMTSFFTSKKLDFLSIPESGSINIMSDHFQDRGLSCIGSSLYYDHDMISVAWDPKRFTVEKLKQTEIHQLTRQCAYPSLIYDAKSKQRYYIISVHLPKKDSLFRKHCLNVIRSHLEAKLEIGLQDHIFIAGDFNTTPESDDFKSFLNRMDLINCFSLPTTNNECNEPRCIDNILFETEKGISNEDCYAHRSMYLSHRQIRSNLKIELS